MLSSRALLLSIVAAAVALVPTQTTRKQSSTALSSWQPNSNFNGKSEARLTDFEREARQADAGARSVEIRKPLGLVRAPRGDLTCCIEEGAPRGDAVGAIHAGETAATPRRSRTALSRRGPPAAP